MTLNISAFFKGRDQLQQKEAAESQTIAAFLIHVERAMQQV